MAKDLQKELLRLSAGYRRLRADLSATNTAVLAVMTSLPPEQQQQLLKAFAEMSALKQQIAEQQSDPAVPEALQQIQEAEARVFQAMQGAQKMAAAKKPTRDAG